MNKKNLELLNDFVNDHVLATHIKVELRENHTSFKQRNSDSKSYYEDCNLLADMLRGAESFCYYLERNGYKIIRSKNEKKD